MADPKARIEAKFNDRAESPDPNGSRTVEVNILSDGLEIDEVRDVDYVKDVIELTGEYKVFVSADSGPSVYTT